MRGERERVRGESEGREREREGERGRERVIIIRGHEVLGHRGARGAAVGLADRRELPP